MTSDLKRSRRKLEMLRWKLGVVSAYSAQTICDGAEYLKSRTWYRDLYRQIKRQELEVRKVILEAQGWIFMPWGYSVSACRNDGMSSGFMKSLRSAVEWAERQNRKAGGK